MMLVRELPSCATTTSMLVCAGAVTKTVRVAIECGGTLMSSVLVALNCSNDAVVFAGSGRNDRW